MSYSVSLFTRAMPDPQPLKLPPLSLEAERMSWAAIGGPDLATVSVTGGELALWSLANTLRCPVEIRDATGDQVWWGYVADVGITAGDLEFGVSLDTMANTVAVAYAYVPVGEATVGTRETTLWDEDVESVAEYGTFERLEPMSTAETLEAENRLASILAAYHYPVPTIGFGGSGLSATLRCRGWLHSLKRRYYENTATAETETTEQISDIVAGVGEFLRGVLIETDSGVFSNEYRDGDTNAWAEVMDLLETGTDDNRRLLAYVRPDRYLRIYEEPAPGAADYAITASGLMFDRFGARLRPGPWCVGTWARLRDAIPASATMTYLADPTRVFLERAEYDVAAMRLVPEPRGPSLFRIAGVVAG